MLLYARCSTHVSKLRTTTEAPKCQAWRSDFAADSIAAAFVSLPRSAAFDPLAFQLAAPLPWGFLSDLVASSSSPKSRIDG